ncbi:MAG: nonstructural protein [Microviridae sp.]|nr:MAG: nonstructural protein [Microviridae sp.]
MIYKIVAIRDRAIDTFGQPAFTASIGGAIRSFGDEIKRVDENNQLNKHPEDFDLYDLGTYDDGTGQFTQDSGPKMIAVGKDYV